ncbi:MAG: sensor histidine kinase, partial [Candidatus Sulfotelmatobacter sp.]
MAILIAIGALFFRQLLLPLLGESNPFHTAWPAVIFAAWYCGMGPAIVTAILEVVGIWYWFLPPAHTFTLSDPKSELSGMVGFLVFSGFIIALGEAYRRSLFRSQSAEQRLQKAHDELERTVKERTVDLTRANENYRELSVQVLRLQDEERRRIARELHDGVGQILAALSMNIARVRHESDKLSNEAAAAISENAFMVEELNRQIRTMSHLLHPPMLDEIGLSSALRWYVDGFSERSKVKVNLDLPETLGRLSSEMELTIFRMIQECLTNVHRHSGSTSAAIRVWEDKQRLRIEVQDHGKGISTEKQSDLNSSDRAGVGFRGMRERLRRLHGILEVQSDATGTTVIASLPLSVTSDRTVAKSAADSLRTESRDEKSGVA